MILIGSPLFFVINLFIRSAYVISRQDERSSSAIDAKGGLDRHWRNARALSSHNPHLYKARVIGDYLLNQALPPNFVAGDDVGVITDTASTASR